MGKAICDDDAPTNTFLYNLLYCHINVDIVDTSFCARYKR